MSLPDEQARALVSARQFLVSLCVPSKTPKIPRLVRHEARCRLKHFPLSWDWKRIVEDPSAMKTAQDMEEHYQNTFWEE
jgi:hypothetical protein